MSTASSKVHPSDEGIPPTAGDDGRMGKTKPTDPERPKGAGMSEQGPVPDVKSGKGLRSLACVLSHKLENLLPA